MAPEERQLWDNGPRHDYRVWESSVDDSKQGFPDLYAAKLRRHSPERHGATESADREAKAMNAA